MDPNQPPQPGLPSEVEVHRAQVPAKSPAELSLDDLLNAAGPLVTAYLDAKRAEQRDEIDAELKIVAEEGRRFRHLLLFAGAVSLGVLVLAALLIFKGQTGEARELIALIVSVAAAAFGGYGVAKGSAPRAPSDD